MDYNFDKSANQDISTFLNTEFLITDGAGGYCASTIGGCNTRKYHGLLVAPQPKLSPENYVLLSSIEEALYYKDRIFNLGMHQYPNTYYPEGYKYITKFTANPIPTWEYAMDDIVLVKELILDADYGIMVRYTVREATESITMKLSPFLAFRNVHKLVKANYQVNKSLVKLENGVKLKLYDGYSDLCMQLSLPAAFFPIPDWYYNIEYEQEKLRGYEYREDQYVPGYFSLELKKGDQFIFCAGFREGEITDINTHFATILAQKPALNSLTAGLENAAEQFIIKSGNDVEIKAGYYWFDRWGRDTFISLPGLTLTVGKPDVFKAVIDTMLPQLKNGVFPNAGYAENAHYNTVDASLWFIWAMQQYSGYEDKTKNVWEDYGHAIKSILENYKNGTFNNIKMDEDGLISAGSKDVALTWMDAVIDSGPVTPRTGKQVEINALWYNAICFALEQAQMANDIDFIKSWESFPDRIKGSFIKSFWNKEKGYLANYTNGDDTNWSIRPNQVFALSLPHSPVPEECRQSIIETVKKHLLTPRGLRTLSPEDLQYCGVNSGGQRTRDKAYHQGTVWPWLIGHFAEAYLKIYGKDAISFIDGLYNGFVPALDELCLNTIAEIYDGDYPHHARGAVSQAWSIAELLRMNQIKDNWINNAG